MRGDDLYAPWVEALRENVPGLELFDAHTHIGENDPDEFRCSTEELLGGLAAVDARGVVFPMHEPGGYSAANDMVIAEAAGSEGRLVAFCRLDPRAEPLAEAERCLATGARGIKLHPRAEDFPLDTPALEPVFALADERRLPVLVHAGRGIPALGRHALAVCERHPGLRLILAHAGICDLAWIWREAESHPNLFFDTSWWAPSDLLALWSLVPPGQILYASDAPYGSPAFAAAMNLRYAFQVGLSPEALRVSFGAQLARLVESEETIDAGPALGSGRLTCDPVLDRVHTCLISAIGQMLNTVEPTEALQLTALACEVGDDVPQAQVCRTVLRLLEMRDEVVAAGGDGRPSRFVPGLPLVVTAACIVRTPDVAMPQIGAPLHDVGERAA